MQFLRHFSFFAFLLLWGCGGAEKAPEPKQSIVDSIPEPDTTAIVVHFDTLAEALGLEEVKWALPMVEQAPAESPSVDLDPIDQKPLELVSHRIELARGDTFDLKVPKGFAIQVVAEGLRRVRFLEESPDGRLFATGMHTLADNKRGKVFILEKPDSSGRFTVVNTWLSRLRNPNALTFYKDENGKDWLYLALTENLLRYPYIAGELSPSGVPDTVASFPAYGLSYKYGGWHLTRTPEFHNGQLYVSVGSSCNVCEEKEAIRATILVMNPDGSNKRIYASGMRNAVDLRWAGNTLFATNMGPDHLGNVQPNDLLYAIEPGKNYGWPYCYESNGRMKTDETKEWENKKINCNEVPLGYAAFAAHASPLGLDYFGDSIFAPSLRNYFLVALHGSGKVRLGNGFEICRVKKDHPPEPFVTGFWHEGKRFGRPCGILAKADGSFYFTDDYRGVIYWVRPTAKNS